MKYCGKVGYVETKESETNPGVYEEVITERTYRGEVNKLSSKWDQADYTTNENISIRNTISIVADPYAYSHFSHIRYIEFMDTKWEVSSIEVSRPRLIITIGGEYNG